MRKILSGVLALALLLSLSVSAFGSGGVSVTIDGAAVPFTDASGCPFIDENSRTLVPLRAVMEAYGCTVDWDAAARTVTITDGETTVLVPVDQRCIYINEQYKAIDTAAIIKTGRTYIPIRAVLEAFGAVVEWEAMTRTILVTSQGEPIVDSTNDIVIDLTSFIKECNATHKAVLDTKFTNAFIKSNAPDFHDTLDLVSEAEAKLLLTSSRRNGEDSCTKEQALRDMDLLFRVYKSFYGPYYYFGGDEAFGAAKDQIVVEIGAGPDRFTLETLEAIIAKNLYFIKDRHMNIGSGLLCETNKIAVHDYYVENLYFYQDDVGYYTKKQGEKWYLASVGADERITEYLKITIDEKGQLCYMLGLTVTVDDARLESKEITLFCGERKVRNPIVWREFEQRSDYSLNETVTVTNGIPLLESKVIPGLPIDDGEYEELQQERLRQMGRALLSQDVVILDLNSGCGWQSLFDSVDHEVHSLGLYKLSKTAEHLGRTNMPWNQGNVGEYVIRYFEGQWGRNDTLVFAVQDNNNYSAAEDTIADIRTIENVVLVGGSTGGTAGPSGATNQHMVLPNTGLFVHFGATLSISPGYTEEGYCFEPDIWVNPVDAADAIYRLCEFYDITNRADMSILSKYQ